MLGSPFRARQRENVKRAPAYAMDSVAEPAPALAFTTSVPASCVMQHLVSTTGLYLLLCAAQVHSWVIKI